MLLIILNIHDHHVISLQNNCLILLMYKVHITLFGNLMYREDPLNPVVYLS